jgi:zinc protease
VYENRPYGRTFLALSETAFDSFGNKHPTAGSVEDVRAASVAELKEFFNRYYAPNNAVVSIVGDVQPDAALAKIKQYFGGIAAQSAPPVADVTEPEPHGERRLVVEDPFVQTSRIDVAYKSVPMATPDWYALRVASGILGTGQSSRLYQKLVRETEVGVSAYATAQSRRTASLEMFVVDPRPGKDLKQIENAIYEEINRLANGPITNAELDRVRLQVRRELIRQSTATLNRAFGLAQDEASYGDPGIANTISRTLERLSAADLQRVTKTYLIEPRRTVIHTVPLSRPATPPPLEPPPADKSVPSSAVERKGRAPVSNDVLRVKLPTPVETVLENGLTVIVLEDHRFPTVTLQVGISGAGSLYDPPNLPGLSSITAQMLRQGTKARSSRQIAEDVENLGAEFSVSSPFGSSSTTVAASGLSDNFDAWFELFADVLLQPVFPTDELNGLKQRTKTQLRQSRATAPFLVTERFARAVYGDHPARVQSTTPEALDAMTSEILARHYAETYLPQNAILTIVGDVNAGRVIRKAQDRLGRWTETDRKETVPPHPSRVPATRILLVDRPNSAQTSLMLGNIGLDRRDPDYIPLLVMNQVVGGERGRLFLKLREERGYTYGAGSTFTAFKYPGPWRMTADVRADATEDSLRLMLQEASRIREEKVPEAELESARRALASRFALSLEDPAQLVTYLNIRKIYGFSADYWDTYPAKIMAVSADEVQRVAQKYVDPAALVIVVVGDRQRIEPAIRKFGTVEGFDAEGRPVEAKVPRGSAGFHPVPRGSGSNGVPGGSGSTGFSSGIH